MGGFFAMYLCFVVPIVGGLIVLDALCKIPAVDRSVDKLIDYIRKCR